MKSPRFFLLAAALSAAVLSAFISCGHSSSPTEPGAVPTATPRAATPQPGATQPPATSTPVPAPLATPTPTPGSTTATVQVGAGGGNVFRDMTSGGSTTTIHVGGTVTWTWSGGFHSSTSGNCCSADGNWNSGTMSNGSFRHTFPSAGSFPYFCVVHGSMMTGMVVVNP
jgi:plastocyanin